MLSIESHSGVTLVQVDRAKANAIDLPLARAMIDTFSSMRGPVVLAGRPGFFSAGIDLKLVPAYSPADQARFGRSIDQLAAILYCYPEPLVAAVTGHAMGGGLCVALCADARIGPRGTAASFGLPEVAIGVPFPPVPLRVVQAELAPWAARQLVLGDRRIDADEALRMGVLDELAPAKEVISRALEIAGQRGKLRAFRVTKGVLRDKTCAWMRDHAPTETWGTVA